PGRGALTECLLHGGARVTAVEVDPLLSEKLAEVFKNEEGFQIVTADALGFSFPDLSKKKEKKLKLVANLPYNISGPMLAKLLDERAAFSVMVLMFQKEVAERITAGPGTKAYGALSVLTKAYTDARAEFDISPHLFRPVPKVTSTVVSFRVLSEPRVPVTDEVLFKRVVKSGFGQRRKTLYNALKMLGADKATIDKALDEAGIDGGRRGETLDLAEFARLASAFGSLF
ncbi:MAG: 16S rRNA (adenine(1518)-N(6)/adenine(1519)-N(6))-dimethyltransferase RsmA, partial [Thermodesulfobacteriota bacterium]